MPWRPPTLKLRKNKTLDPYKIFVSEVMLQQTQVSRVLEKYPIFIKQFPSFSALAVAPMSLVLMAWQGLGYNRRVLFLKRSAEIIVRDFHGRLPCDPRRLQELPGVGPGTAGSIVAFAYNMPTVFIETNIRRTFLYFFFPRKKAVSDEMLMPYILASLDKKSPRDWYYALMDYGALLARTAENPNRRSAHYTKQAKFDGSIRQARGAIVNILLKQQSATLHSLVKVLGYDELLVRQALEALQKEGLLIKQQNRYRIG